jgi:hypothetical protein
MRMVAPDSLGIADAEVPMNTTFAVRQPRRGVAGVAAQSGDVRITSPLVVFGADALDDRTARLTPLTDVAAVLLRLGRLADDHPQIAELDLDPALARSDSAVAADVRIRVLPAHGRDPYLRRLP